MLKTNEVSKRKARGSSWKCTEHNSQKRSRQGGPALTHSAPNCPPSPTLFSGCATQIHPVAASKQTLHPSVCKRNRILMKLVALFPLLFAASGDVLCSKFGGVWETLWIFSYKMDTWQMRENKQNSYCLQRCQEFHPLIFGLQIWLSHLPRAP